MAAQHIENRHQGKPLSSHLRLRLLALLRPAAV
jgi:hypothetical protein